jgi:hypothetical protein
MITSVFALQDHDYVRSLIADTLWGNGRKRDEQGYWLGWELSGPSH